MKKRSVLCTSIFFLGMLLLVGTFSYAQTTKPIELKLSHGLSTMHNLHVNVFVPFAKELEQRTKGRAKITIYPSESLGKIKDQYDLVLQGVTDMAWFVPAYTTGRFPLTSVMELPMHVPSAKVGSRVIWELYDKYLKADYPGIKIITLCTDGPGQLHMVKKPVRTLEDIKGLRIRSSGVEQTALLRELGASPLTIPIADVYDALQKGMADGAVFDFSAIVDFKLHELMRYHTIANMYVLPFGMVMNQKVWDGLPADIQKAITEISGAHMSEVAGASFDKYDSLGREAAKRVKAEIITLSPQEQKRWDDRASPIIEKWIASVEAKGAPGKKIYEETRSLVDKYSK